VVVLLACVLQVSGSDLGLDIDCRVFRVFYKFLQTNVKIGRYHFLPNAFKTVVYLVNKAIPVTGLGGL
jgi:hypothetical protein